MRFLIVSGFISFAALALCSCSSPSIPPWAVASLKRQYRSEMRIVDTSHGRRMHIARPTVYEAKVDGADVANHKASEEVASVGNVPVSSSISSLFLRNGDNVKKEKPNE